NPFILSFKIPSNPIPKTPEPIGSVSPNSRTKIPSSSNVSTFQGLKISGGTLEEAKDTEAASTERSAALRTMNRVSQTMSRWTATMQPKLQAVRSGLSVMSYRFGTANFGRRGWPLNCSISTM
ncbi:unnamed protein product, partial [Prunus brigantina]